VGSGFATDRPLFKQICKIPTKEFDSQKSKRATNKAFQSRGRGVGNILLMFINYRSATCDQNFPHASSASMTFLQALN